MLLMKRNLANNLITNNNVSYITCQISKNPPHKTVDRKEDKELLLQNICRHAL